MRLKKKILLVRILVLGLLFVPFFSRISPQPLGQLRGSAAEVYSHSKSLNELSTSAIENAASGTLKAVITIR